jgi:hypothetical protein
MMVREMGVISDLKTAEAILINKDCTIGFDATTQDGVHVHTFHVTFNSVEHPCLVIVLDQLPGGTAEDYSSHILRSVEGLAKVYAGFHNLDSTDIHKAIIENISNTLTDRVASNHAAIRLINSAWNKTLFELNCHLHPLDSVTSKVKTSLIQCEDGNGKIFGKDCLAANVVLQMNKLRYKDGKGDPQGFKNFLTTNGLAKGFIPRYRGNRLHILFHLCGKYFAYFELFSSFLKNGTSLGGLRSSLLTDFENPITMLEFHVLGLIGKIFSGPWMKAFYTAVQNETPHLDCVKLVKNAVAQLKEFESHPLEILSTETDCLGNSLDFGDSILVSLKKAPTNVVVYKNGKM